MVTMDSTNKPWYMDRKFDQYWEHYNACFSWMNMHCQAAAKSTCEDPASAWKKWSEYATRMYHLHRNHQTVANAESVGHVDLRQTQSRQPREATRNSTKRKSSSRASSRHSRRAKKRRDKKRSLVANSQNEPDRLATDHGDDDDVEEDGDLTCDIPYSDDLLKFLAQSAKHRRQREKQKRLAELKEKENNYGEDFDRSYCATTRAPKERPGQRRTAEMKTLYGKGAAMIHGMETAMQLTFDRNCDIKQPKHWPNLPLNIKFD